MVPQTAILEWQSFAPWSDNSSVEQDLLISRAIVEIFNNDFLKSNLAFRGGTALYKLFLSPAMRYSRLFRQRNKLDYSDFSLIPHLWQSA
jgi:predicted nucleotidyltransferase component of viral defense system